MRQRSRFTTGAALFLAVGMLAAACGGGSDDGNDGADGGGSLTYALEAATADGWCLPEAQLAISGIQVARSVYDTLTVPDGNGEFQPHLAESVEPNEDFTEWTITLRPDITFHDDTPLDAEVVKNNIDAFRGAYEGRASLLFVFVLSDIEDVRVESDLELVVETSRPWVSFDSYLYASGRLGISAQAQLDGDDCDANMIGTGPFVLDNWDRNSHIVNLSRNDNYWREDSEGNQLPYLDELEYQVITSADDATNALFSGEIDAFHMSSNTEALLFWELMEEEEAGEINFVQSDDFAEVGFVMLNNAEPPFDNINARLAVAHAVDREGIAEELSEGLITPASGPFAPGTVGYLEDAGFPQYDTDEAESYIEAYENETGRPLEVRLTHTPEQSLRRLVNLVQADLEAVGIEVTTNTFEQSELIENAIGGNFQAMTFRNYPGLDPDNLYVWWYGGSPVNFSRFNDDELNELLDRGRETADPDERTQIYEDINRRFGEQVFSQWASWTIWAVPSAPDVGGIVGARPVGAPDDGSADYTGLAVGHDPAFLQRGQD